MDASGMITPFRYFSDDAMTRKQPGAENGGSASPITQTVNTESLKSKVCQLWDNAS